MPSMNSKIMPTVNAFIGINEASDGQTELRQGEASKCINWYITDGLNLTTRPGVRILHDEQREPGTILAAWSGKVSEREFIVIADYLDGHDRIFLLENDELGQKKVIDRHMDMLGADPSQVVKIFPYAGSIFIMSEASTVEYDGISFKQANIYIPKVVVGAPPPGGGTVFEGFNLLTSKRRIDYSSDGTSVAYSLPKEATAIDWVKIDDELTTDGSYDAATHTYTFTSAPIKGVGNVEFQYDTDAAEAVTNKAIITKCRLSENFNGYTDTRIFVAGDGTNKLHYTGVPNDAAQSYLYFPAMAEIAIDMSASPVTGMVRHYSRLAVFKPDGAYTVSYDTITLPTGEVTAGFRLTPASREYGSDVLGQIQTVSNAPRTITKGGIYEWRVTSNYRDERYAVRVSDKVRKSLLGADIRKIVICDDNYTNTYYVFLNDDDGTVLVNRYGLIKENVWFMYKSDAFKNIRYALMHSGNMVMLDTAGNVMYMDEQFAYDEQEKMETIVCEWESGFAPYNADYRRKNSALIYVSCLPKGLSSLQITAATDKRDEYMTKVIRNSNFAFSRMVFSQMSFSSAEQPKINRIKLKVKKFVYYKLKFIVNEPGCGATVLSYDQEIRYSGMAK